MEDNYELSSDMKALIEVQEFFNKKISEEIGIPMSREGRQEGRVWLEKALGVDAHMNTQRR